MTLAPPRLATAGAVVLLAFGLTMGATGALTALRPPGAQLIILGLTAAVVLATSVGEIRTWVDAIPLRALVGFHAVRFVGAVFLVLSARGFLSPLFATRAGWGDIAAAAIALLLVVWGPPITQGRRLAYVGWSVFGILDLVVAVGTATLVVLRGDVPGMDPILRVPLVLVPTFFVPVLLASHVVILRRLLRPAASHG